MRRIVPRMTALFLLGLALWYQADGGVSADEPAQREFWLSTDPTVEVLKVTYAGGMTNLVTTHQVFADGRFLLQFVSSVDGEVKRQHEIQLSDEELNALVTIAVEGGLIEHDHERYQKKMRLYRSSDGGTMTFELNIERYRGPQQKAWGPASSTVTVRGVSSARRHFPDVDAFEALADIAREINRYRSLAEASDEQK